MRKYQKYYLVNVDLKEHFVEVIVDVVSIKNLIFINKQLTVIIFDVGTIKT